jgi:zinc transport system substrate-binding protein
MKKLNPLWYVGGSLVIVTLVVALVWKQTQSTNPTHKEGTIDVVVTLYPWQYLAKQIGGEYVTVTNIVPPGAEPHDFAPLPQDIAAIYASDIFVLHGAGLDPWAETLTPEDFTTANHATIVMTANVALLPSEADGGHDPHIWLDPVLMQSAVATLRDTFSTFDPGHAADYAANATAVMTDLQALDEQLATVRSTCELGNIIVAHDAFTYFGDRYDITIHPILGMNPNETPSARALADLTDIAVAEGIDYIFFETLASSELAETLASEVGARTLVLNPLEGLTTEQAAAGEDYSSLMKQNIVNLKTAMHCSAALY